MNFTKRGEEERGKIDRSSCCSGRQFWWVDHVVVYTSATARWPRAFYYVLLLRALQEWGLRACLPAGRGVAAGIRKEAQVKKKKKKIKGGIKEDGNTPFPPSFFWNLKDNGALYIFFFYYSPLLFFYLSENLPPPLILALINAHLIGKKPGGWRAKIQWCHLHFYYSHYDDSCTYDGKEREGGR